MYHGNTGISSQDKAQWNLDALILLVVLITGWGSRSDQPICDTHIHLNDTTRDAGMEWPSELDPVLNEISHEINTSPHRIRLDQILDVIIEMVLIHLGWIERGIDV